MAAMSVRVSGATAAGTPLPPARGCPRASTRGTRWPIIPAPTCCTAERHAPLTPDLNAKRWVVAGTVAMKPVTQRASGSGATGREDPNGDDVPPTAHGHPAVPPPLSPRHCWCRLAVSAPTGCTRRWNVFLEGGGRTIARRWAAAGTLATAWARRVTTSTTRRCTHTHYKQRTMMAAARTSAGDTSVTAARRTRRTRTSAAKTKKNARTARRRMMTSSSVAAVVAAMSRTTATVSLPVRAPALG
mmetsp:Transcript_21608/g.61489  ORF Transcript_21608/g.61489 Transcript_21608/m.61489 type:complete len:244 (+) Transcript_21608:320-1051(+)